MNKATPIRLLIVDDESAHVEAIRRAFEDQRAEADIRTAGSLEEYRETVRDWPPDFALVDLNLPDGRATDILRAPMEEAPFPVIVMTAFGNQQTAVEALKAGALDYIVKSPDTFATLPHIAERSLQEWNRRLEHRRDALALQESEARFRELFENSLVAISQTTPDGRLVRANQAYANLYGYSSPAEMMTSEPHIEHHYAHPEDRRQTLIRLRENGVMGPREIAVVRRDGSRAVLLVTAREVRDIHGNLHLFQAEHVDVTERVQAEKRDRLARVVLERLNRASVSGETVRDILELIKRDFECDAVGIRLKLGDDFPFFAQRGFAADFMLTENSILVRDPDYTPCRDEDGNIPLECTCGLVLSGKADGSQPFFTAGGSFWINDSSALLAVPAGQDSRLHPRNRCIHDGYRSMGLIPLRFGKKIIGLLQINDKRPNRLSLELIEFLEGLGNSIGIALAREQAEEARGRLEDQLRQAIKMEVVGRLAGGVAHDFNNQLQVILGCAELLRASFPEDNPAITELDELRKAAERSAGLTRQLLAFSRKQVITPVVLNLNESLAGSVSLLRRLIGENIHLTYSMSSEPCFVYLDPGQLDQILMNLAVNSRDAIVDTGTLSIGIAPVTLGPDECRGKADFVPPGNYVVMTFKDSGVGMTPDVLEHIFEPFFTTKSLGKGTGLGLATVYGIVKQNHGAITVQSESGKGAVFTIYLPRSRKEPSPAVPAPANMPGGHETILVVEDEQMVLDLVRRTLSMLGYTVLAAGDPSQARDLCRRHANPIHLLLTDVIMPGMGGRELAGCIRETRPEIHVLFMSGYTADAMISQAHFEEPPDVLQKPFDRTTLACRIRAALDGPLRKI